MLPGEDFRGPDKDLKRASHVEDLGAGRSQKDDDFGMVHAGERLCQLPHEAMLMFGHDGSNDKRASFSAMAGFWESVLRK